VSENEKKVDLQAELGMSRRDLLRRGAVVGGALLWVAPAIQSLTPPAYAQTVSVQAHTCCSCYKKGPTGVQCQQDHFTYEACVATCGRVSNVREYKVGWLCGTDQRCSVQVP
jgi:hypothetical protein